MINLDEKEIEKERKQQEKEEKKIRKRKNQIKKEESIQKEKKAGKKYISDEEKKKLILFLIIIIIIVFIFILRAPILKYINNVGRDDSLNEYILITDLTGYTEEDAKIKLNNSGIVNIKIKYIVDQFTEDNCVVKTNKSINAFLKPDDEIILYICDKSLLSKDIKNSLSDNQLIADKSYFSLENISIIDITIKDNYFYIIVKNNNKEAISNIDYKIGYKDEKSAEIGEGKYELNDDDIILPGEKYIIKDEIKNNNAFYIYVSGFSYEKLPIPESERK